MKINHKNQLNDEFVCATIRMNKAEYRALREYMHTEDGKDVYFPYGVKIVKRGYGWYFMSTTRPLHGVRKMEFALKVLRWFNQWHEEQIEAEIKRLEPVFTEVSMQVAAYTADAGFHYATPQQVPQPPITSMPAATALASPAMLQMLASKFSKERRA